MSASRVPVRHAVSRLVAGGAVLTALAGCAVAESRAEPGDAPSPSPIRVTAAVDVRRTRLEVRWQVSNVADKPVLVYARPLRHDRTPDPAHGIYVTQTAAGVQFALRAFALPERPSGEAGGMAAHDVVEAVRLAPGETTDGHAFVDLPLRTFEPYRSPVAIAQTAPLRAQVCIGALHVADPLPGAIQLLAGERFAVYHESSTAEQQVTACSGMLAIPVDG